MATALALILLTPVSVLKADTVLVPQLELREETPGSYLLSATLSPLVFSRIRPVVLPPTCAPLGDPEIRTEGGVVRWALEFSCDPQLDRDAILYLPWTVDGVRLTATWADGDERQGLFGREGLGVLVPVRLLMSRDRSLGVLVREHLVAGVRHFFSGGHHLALTLVLGLSLSVGSAVTVLAGITAGHAIALVLAELGAVGLPTAPAEATVAAAALVLAAGLVRGDDMGRGGLLLGGLVGVVHGLGAATALAGAPAVGDDLIPALFLMSSGIDVAGWVIAPAVALLLAGLWQPEGRAQRSSAWVVGTASVFAGLLAVSAGFAPPTPAAASAIALETTTGQGGPGAGAAGAPDQLTATGQLTSPLMSYVTVEPYQVRHEVLASVASLGAWIPLPLDGAGTIPTTAQPELLDRAAALLDAESPLAIDGVRATPAARSASFVTVDPAGVLTRTQPQPESATDGVVGITLVYETGGLPDEVEVSWGLLSRGVEELPLTITDPATVSETTITAEVPTLEWRNTLGDFELPTIDAIRTEKPRVPVVSLVLVVMAFALAYLGSSRRRGGTRAGRSCLGRTQIPARVAVVCVVVAYALYPFARVSAEVPLIAQRSLSTERAGDVVEGLLANVYRSFDIHNEEAIYDRLSLTVTGDQLLDVYLESRTALELESRGGARVRIDEVVVREVRAVRRAAQGGYEIDATWTVGGSVSHFGHEHFRQNRYDALISLVPVDRTWKISGIELLEERRLM